MALSPSTIVSPNTQSFKEEVPRKVEQPVEEKPSILKEQPGKSSNAQPSREDIRL
jgi:hypothetical protein